MKSQRFSPTVSCYTAYLRKKPSKKKNRTWLRHQGKKKRAPGPRQPGSDTKQKKRAPGPLTWPVTVTKQKKLSQIPSKKKRAPGPPQPGSDTKQKKRVHLDHSDLAQIHSCSLDIIPLGVSAKPYS